MTLVHDGARIDRYVAVSSALALLSDRRLHDLIGDAAVIGSGIGGTSMVLDVQDTAVFVKCVPDTSGHAVERGVQIL